MKLVVDGVDTVVVVDEFVDGVGVVDKGRGTGVWVLVLRH